MIQFLGTKNSNKVSVEGKTYEAGELYAISYVLVGGVEELHVTKDHKLDEAVEPAKAAEWPSDLVVRLV